MGRGEAGNERNREHEHEAATCCCVAALVVRFVRSHSLTGLFSLCTSSCVVLLGRHRRGHYCHHGFDIVVATIVVHIVWPPSRILFVVIVVATIAMAISEMAILFSIMAEWMPSPAPAVIIIVAMCRCRHRHRRRQSHDHYRCHCFVFVVALQSLQCFPSLLPDLSAAVCMPQWSGARGRP